MCESAIVLMTERRFNGLVCVCVRACVYVRSCAIVFVSVCDYVFACELNSSIIYIYIYDQNCTNEFKTHISPSL